MVAADAAAAAACAKRVKAKVKGEAKAKPTTKTTATRKRKPKMTLADTTKMRDLIAEAIEDEDDKTSVKRCIFMDALEPEFTLRDIYRETVHPRYKAADRGCYDGAAMIASLTEQVGILSTEG